MTQIPKNMPFEFVIDLLYPLEVEIKPMFGCFSVYTGGKLVLFLRDREKDAHENGVWVAATDEGYVSLCEELGNEKPLKETGKKWVLIGMNKPDFEERVRTACEMIVDEDPRIGRAVDG